MVDWHELEKWNDGKEKNWLFEKMFDKFKEQIEKSSKFSLSSI